MAAVIFLLLVLIIPLAEKIGHLSQRRSQPAIENKGVRWHEYHVPASLTQTPDPATEPAL